MMFLSRGIDPSVADLLPRPHAPLAADTFDLAGRTRASSATIHANAINLVFFGQSLNNNSVDATYAPTHGAAVFNGSLAHRGAVFLAAKPLLASDLVLDHHGRWLADEIITSGLAPQVVLWMSAQGGSYCADWVPGGGSYGGGGSRTGALAHRIGLTARCIAAAGLAGRRTIVDWSQGEADTDAATTQADYTAHLGKIIAECRKTGLVVPGKGAFFANLNTRISGLAGSRTAIRAAQAAVVDGVLVRAGADIDTIGAEHRPDGTHPGASGAAIQAALKRVAYTAFLGG